MNHRISTLAVLLAAFVVPAVAQLTATPSTTEGPYYTFNSGQTLDTTWLVGADNDLTLVTGKTTRASGTRFLLSGTLVNTAGTAISGATIELWHADNNGIYYYPNTAGNNISARDTNFQSYGTCVTDSTGAWSFRTVRPGLYVGRIRHFHYKVRVNGSSILTSQFMFEADRSSFSSDNVSASLVRDGTMELTVLNPTTGVDSADSASALLATKQIVVNLTSTTSTGTTTTGTTSTTGTTTATTGTTTGTSTATSSGGGGGAPSLWFVAVLSAVALARWQHRK